MNSQQHLNNNVSSIHKKTQSTTKIKTNYFGNFLKNSWNKGKQILGIHSGKDFIPYEKEEERGISNCLEYSNLFVWGRFNEIETEEKINFLEIKNKKISQIFLGETHIAVLDDDQKAFGFGNNSSAQLDANLKKVDDLLQLSLNSKIKIESISLGTDFSFLLDTDFNVMLIRCILGD